jgi:arabinogalactan endo-1,4-beta-galactosidase
MSLRKPLSALSAAGLLLVSACFAVACSDDSGTDGASGGSPTGGGGQHNGAAGSTNAGQAHGGSTATAGTGTATGGSGTTTGGSGSGTTTGGSGTTTGGSGTTTGGSSPGGSGSGGASTGGAGGAAAGMGGTAGAGGSAVGPSFWIGADITFHEPQPAATRANLLASLKAHGFNAIRLRTFVDPKAADGYDQTNGDADIAHTVAFGKQIVDAGMLLLVDFHYSDNWADPGKQCVPIAWQSFTTIAQLATAVHDYTKDSITKLIAGGARPAMVQIGNETTPGMLMHRCDSGGQPTGSNPVTGNTSNWDNLGALLKAGVQGVKEVDPTIMTSFHIDRGGDKASDNTGAALETSRWWLSNAVKYVTPDAFGESCYQRYQGDPNSAADTKASWTSTFAGLATDYPNIKFFSAEYGPMQREINDVLFSMPNKQGIGTFNWEPATQGDWNTGHDLLRRNGATYTEQPDLAKYDEMKTAYASRL